MEDREDTLPASPAPQDQFTPPEELMAVPPEQLEQPEPFAPPDGVPDSTPVEDAPARPRAFEDLTLGEALTNLLRRPRATWEALWRTVDRTDSQPPVLLMAPPGAARASLGGPDRAVGRASETFSAGFTGLISGLRRRPMLVQLALLVLVALLGAQMLSDVAVRLNPTTFPVGGALLLLVGALMTAFTLRYVNFPRLTALALPPRTVAPARRSLDDVLARHGLRIAFFGTALILSFGAWVLNADNTFTPIGVFCWVASVLLYLVTLAGPLDSSSAWVTSRPARLIAFLRRPVTFRWSWSLLALLVIVAVAAWFRFSNLTGAPPEMTSDHVEKLLDARKVFEGLTPVFFPNNGGRESFMMYYLAALSQITGLPFTHTLLKIGSGIIGMIVVVLAYWMGRAVFGEEDRRLGELVGLAMAALIAVSYWHTMLSRLGLRIVLTTLAVIVIFIFLARAVRHNRRADYLIAGFVLGLSMYFYQAMRMFPLVVIAAVMFAVALRVRSGRTLRAYVFNLAALVIIALAVFVPLGRFWADYPGNFWERTGGRFFGEETIVIRDDQGRIIEERAVTPDERWAAFWSNLGVLADNYRRSILMFNYSGDRAFITGEPLGAPQLDPVSGAFFVLGLGVVAARIIRRRDPVDWVLPIAVLIMLLPTALSIAFPIEVPSATRASGSLPFVYLIAALGLALVLRGVYETVHQRWLRYAVTAGVIALLVLGASRNAHTYFVAANRSYREAVFPYKQAGEIVAGFAESTGAPGNAFMVGWDMWWDWRILGVNAGYPDWPNGLWYDQLPARILDQIDANNDTLYALRPDRQMLFILHQQAQEPLQHLQAAFPGGGIIEVKAFSPLHDFILYVSPPLGCQWALDNLKTLPPICRDATLTDEMPGG